MASSKAPSLIKLPRPPSRLSSPSHAPAQFSHVPPAGGGVKAKAPASLEPGLSVGLGMSAFSVDDQVQGPRAGEPSLEPAKKTQDPLLAHSLPAVAYHHALHLLQGPPPPGEAGRLSFRGEGQVLTLLLGEAAGNAVPSEYQHLVGRIQVESNHIADGALHTLKATGQARLQPVKVPDSLDRCRADPLGSRHALDSPTLALGRLGPERSLHDLPDLAGRDPSPGASTWSGGRQGGETALLEAPPPEQHRHQRGAQSPGDAPAGDPICRQQNEASSEGHLTGRLGGVVPSLQDAPLFRGEGEGGGRPGHRAGAYHEPRR